MKRVGAALLLFTVGGPAFAALPEGLRSAEQHLAHAEFEEAAAAFERYAGEPDAAWAPEALSRAVWLRALLGQDASAERDEDALWKSAVTSSAISPDEGRSTATLAARTTLKVARFLGRKVEWKKASEQVLRRIGTIERTAPSEWQAAAHGLLGEAFDALGEVARALAEHRKVVAMAQRGEADARRGWGEEAQYAAGVARLFLADRERAKVERITLTPLQGPSNARSVRAYITGTVVPWWEQKSTALGAADRAYATVLGIETPPPPPRSPSGGDPNAPWDDPPLVAPSPQSRLSVRWAVVAAAKAGAMWAEPLETWRRMPIVYGMGVVGSTAPVFQRTKEWFALCASTWVAHRRGDAQPCFAWLTANARAEYPSFDELTPAPSGLSFAPGAPTVLGRSRLSAPANR